MTQSNLIAIDLAKNIFQVAQLKGNKLKFNSQSKKQVKKSESKNKWHPLLFASKTENKKE
ncbi:hypothetical protein [Pseudoalteromonas sp. NC201]|uniref:hypothetical protein n=1 Tax=Pseudoalteromonas sp. NC201 TaxID=1514074 RepID=UPI000C7D2ED2|nr:hypothetical protein [Pseudoalteromonas sp. NC201]AUJ69244.1 hypothetical protein PNC201_04630 [Pseudoalteromonas sp. NC201]